MYPVILRGFFLIYHQWKEKKKGNSFSMIFLIGLILAVIVAVGLAIVTLRK